MANPANFTITDLTTNGAVTQPTAQTVDTNGTVPANIDGHFGRVIVELVNGAANACTVEAVAGAQPPSFRAGMGNAAITLAATGGAGDKQIFGPFEGARFTQLLGALQLKFQAASGNPNVAVRVYRLPRS